MDISRQHTHDFKNLSATLNHNSSFASSCPFAVKASLKEAKNLRKRHLTSHLYVCYLYVCYLYVCYLYVCVSDRFQRFKCGSGLQTIQSLCDLWHNIALGPQQDGAESKSHKQDKHLPYQEYLMFDTNYNQHLLTAQAEGITEESITEDRITEEGITEDGITEEGITEDRITEEGITEDRITEEGITEEGITEDRITEEGITEGITEEGITELHRLL